MKVVFWRNYPFLIFLPSLILLSDDILSLLSTCGHTSGCKGSDVYLCMWPALKWQCPRQPKGLWETGGLSYM